MRKTKSLAMIIISVFLALVFVLSGCSSSAPASQSSAPAATTTAPAQVVTMRVSSYGGATFIPRLYQERWMKMVGERAGGKIKFEFFPTESLVKLRDAWEATGKGIVEAACVWPYQPDKQGIIADVSVMPYNWNWEKFNPRYKQPGGFAEWAEPFFTRDNLKLIQWSAHGDFEICARDGNIKTIEDVKGKIARASHPAFVPFWKLLGANPTEMPTADVYTALQRGTLDISTHTFAAAESGKYYDVAPYLTAGKMASGGLIFAMNLKFYNDLSADLKKIMDDVTVDCDKWYLSIVEQDVKDVRSRLEKIPKVKIYDLPADEIARWQKTIEPMYADFAKKYGDDWKKFEKAWATLK